MPSLESVSSSSTLPDDLSSYMSQPLPEEQIEMETLPPEAEPEPEPENKIVVFGKQKAGSTSTTATEQSIPKKNDIDNSIPTFLRPINAPLPAINIKDVIGLRPSASETKDIRQARINKLDKKPLLAIEDEPIDIPTFTADELKAYKEKTQETRQAESTNTEPEEDAEKPELTAFKTKIKSSTNKELGNILTKNGIKEPTTGNNYYIDTLNRVKVRGGRRVFDKTYLTGELLKAFNDGLIN